MGLYDCVSRHVINSIRVTHRHISYNRVNGTHVSENEFLLTKVLRQEWNFAGMVGLFFHFHAHVSTTFLKFRS